MCRKWARGITLEEEEEDLRIGSSNHKATIGCHHETALSFSRLFDRLQEAFGDAGRPLGLRSVLKIRIAVGGTILDPVA